MTLRKLIRTAYKTLSVVNTASVVASGNPDRIARHLLRKQLVRRAGRVGVRHYKRGQYRLFS